MGVGLVMRWANHDGGVAAAAGAAAIARGIARRAVVALVIALAGLGTWLAAGGGGHAGARGEPPLAPLDTLNVARPTNEGDFVADRTAAVKLGKAFFWDMQAGSDGRTACASCHYNAGADNRSRNEVNPRGTAGFTVGAPNSKLSAADFPFHRLSNPDDRASAVVSDTDNVSGSQGVLPSLFKGITLGEPVDDQTFAVSDPDFMAGATPVRRSTGRNTPSVINAVFNFRNFWDGRAQNEFNGVTPFGSRDTSARVGQADASGHVAQVPVILGNSSLASQAVGPPGNPVEMSSDGRTLSDIGRKLLSLRPLREQIVSPSDSVLGADVADAGRGLKDSYGDLIRAAFQPKWWNSLDTVTAPNGRSYSLMEFNFSLFWGLAIQEYESTLVSDQTPADRFMKGDATALSASAARGLSLFNGAAGCSSCHSGAAMTSASVDNIAVEGATGLDKLGRWTDTGFLNIGVRPTESDPGVGGFDPFGNPLSIARLGAQTPDAMQGAFKVPGLRNVALTAPYFHNGGELTLRQVVDFYSRGGSFTNPELSPDMEIRNLTGAQKDDIVAFLEALTDPRVQNQSAPFDHPELFVPAGEQTDDAGAVVTDAGGRAVDCFKRVAPTGAAGGRPLVPFPNFDDLPCDEAVDIHNPPPVPRPPAAPASPVPAAAPADAPGSASPASVAAAPVAPAGPVGVAAPVPGVPAAGPLGSRRAAARCVVPALRGRTVAQARRLLAASGCRLGRVHGLRAGMRRPVIASQFPGARAKGPKGMHVALRVRARR
jgi:cytochrome c peroxidase